MCGIAGLIHRDGATSVGKEMTAMLKSLKHRGPNSTGFAVYGTSTDNEYVMRLKLAEQEDLTKDHHIRDEIRQRQAEVDDRLPSSAPRPSRLRSRPLMPSAIGSATPAIRASLPTRSSRSRAPRFYPSAARSS